MDFLSGNLSDKRPPTCLDQLDKIKAARSERERQDLEKRDLKQLNQLIVLMENLAYEQEKIAQCDNQLK